jgi:hypothetical protein
MMRRIIFRSSFACLTAVSIALTLFTSAATILNKHNGSPADRLVVHEWGTFTTVSGADGKEQLWDPLNGPSELPSFVYRSMKDKERCGPKCNLALVRMETPVLYFYADRELRVSVKVGFPKGQITEWYPQARSTNPGIDWGSLTVLAGAIPGLPPGFPVDQSRSHYYPARETDAAPVRIGDEKNNEYEKFLFYRGIGNFELPLRAMLTGDRVIVRNLGQDEIAPVILFENRGGRTGWSVRRGLTGEAPINRPALDGTGESLSGELERVLTAQGLHQKEAMAMVKTWRESWFEEGLRVFYIVPRKAVDAILPTTITPVPSEFTRVLVARAEIITPETEREIQAAAKQFCEGAAEEKLAAIKRVQRFGRFAVPVLRQVAARENGRSIQELLLAAQR